MSWYKENNPPQKSLNLEVTLSLYLWESGFSGKVIIDLITLNKVTVSVS